MPRFFNPKTIVAPASRYSQGALCDQRARRLVISGQIGVRPDGSVADGLEAQMEVAWDNLEAVLAEAGMTVHDLVKITGYCVPSGSVAPFRTIRDQRLAGHAPACTYIENIGLANPALLFEIEGEAVRED